MVARETTIETPWVFRNSGEIGEKQRWPSFQYRSFALFRLAATMKSHLFAGMLTRRVLMGVGGEVGRNFIKEKSWKILSIILLLHSRRTTVDLKLNYES